MVDGAYLPSHSLQQRAQADNADWLVETASPVLEELCQKVSWQSVLTIPRLTMLKALSESVKAVELRASTEGVGTTSEMRSARVHSKRSDARRLQRAR